jgi:hypothetical protein
MGLGEDGSMNAIIRCSEGDKKFHVKGALVVAPDKALSHALDQLKRLKDASGSNPVFILSPWPRFVRTSCCSTAGHVSNSSDQDFLQTILRDLTKLRYHLRKTFHPTTVIDSMELICGNSYSLEKAEQVINGGWALDPVHPTKHIYAKSPTVVTARRRPYRPGKEPGARATGAKMTAAPVEVDTSAEWRPALASNTR